LCQVRTLHLRIVALRLPHQKSGSFAVQGIGRVGVPKKLRNEDFEDVNHVVHWRPCLVDDVETDRAGTVRVSKIHRKASRIVVARSTTGFNSQLIYVGMEYPVDEANTRALIGVLIGQLDMDLPETALERGCFSSIPTFWLWYSKRTILRPLEPDVELLPVVYQYAAVGSQSSSRKTNTTMMLASPHGRSDYNNILLSLTSVTS
jgi:hypothetical protein